MSAPADPDRAGCSLGDRGTGSGWRRRRGLPARLRVSGAQREPARSGPAQRLTASWRVPSIRGGRPAPTVRAVTWGRSSTRFARKAIGLRCHSLMRERSPQGVTLGESIPPVDRWASGSHTALSGGRLRGGVLQRSRHGGQRRAWMIAITLFTGAEAGVAGTDRDLCRPPIRVRAGPRRADVTTLSLGLAAFRGAPVRGRVTSGYASSTGAALRAELIQARPGWWCLAQAWWRGPRLGEGLPLDSAADCGDGRSTTSGHPRPAGRGPNRCDCPVRVVPEGAHGRG